MNYTALIKAINSASTQLQSRAAAAVNQALVLRNWLVGAWIVEYEQNGKDRAKYGARLLETLAADLATSKQRGLSDARVLRDCRVFYQTYPQIRGSVTRELQRIDASKKTAKTAIPKFLLTAASTGLDVLTEPPSDSSAISIRGSLTRELANSADTVCRFQDAVSLGTKRIPIRGALPPEFPTPLSSHLVLLLSWTKLQELIRIDDPWKRAFFENECLKANWSVRQLQRQIGSLLYERTGLSTNKQAVIERARKQEPQETINDLIRDPYILEFTGLAERPEYLESDLESALLTHIQSFLLELGEGFCFEARQKRITVGRQHDYIDLVFYHRKLRCHVLIDLKIRAFKHGDAGQMNFYLNWWKAHGMDEGDHPPVGIILCSDRDQAAVEYATVGIDQKLFVSRYLVALPSAEKLRTFLEEDRDRIESLMPATVPAKKAAKRASR